MSVFALLLILQIGLYAEPAIAAEPQNPPLRFLFTRFFHFWQQPHISFRWLILLSFVFIPSGMVVSNFIPRSKCLGLEQPTHRVITFRIRTPLCYRFCSTQRSITQKIFSGFRHPMGII